MPCVVCGKWEFRQISELASVRTGQPNYSYVQGHRVRVIAPDAVPEKGYNIKPRHSHGRHRRRSKGRMK
jgi:hypothetical protein